MNHRGEQRRGGVTPWAARESYMCANWQMYHKCHWCDKSVLMSSSEASHGEISRPLSKPLSHLGLRGYGLDVISEKQSVQSYGIVDPHWLLSSPNNFAFVAGWSHPYLLWVRRAEELPVNLFGLCSPNASAEVRPPVDFSDPEANKSKWLVELFSLFRC